MIYSTETITEPAFGLEDVLITAEIEHRPPRFRDLQAEHTALQSLANGLREIPEKLLQQLAESACELCNAHTAGISVANGDEVRWLAVAGTYSHYLNHTMPRNQSPCGVCLDRPGAQLFATPGRYFTGLAGVSPPIAETLILSINDHGVTPSGTLWIASHNARSRFDAEDLRILTALGGFAAVALRIGRRKQFIAKNPLHPFPERRLSESKAKEAVARLEAVLDTAVDGIITIDVHGRIESANPAIERIFGYSATELFGDNISILMPEPMRSAHDSYLQRYVNSGERRDIVLCRREVMGRRSDGSEFPLELSVTEPHIANRRIFTAILRDITERKRTEEEIKHRLQELRDANEELERFNRAAVNRELRMVELKKQINELCVQSGRPQRYRIDFEGYPPLEDAE